MNKNSMLSQHKDKILTRSARSRKNSRKISAGLILACIAVGVMGILLTAYLCIAAYYANHFFPNTIINGRDFSGQTSAEAAAFFEMETENYTLTVIENGGQTEQILGKDISLAWKENREIEQLLKKQNIFGWPRAFFQENTIRLPMKHSYNDSVLEERILSLHAITVEQTPAVSAFPKFDGNTFVIEPETYGTAVDPDAVRKSIIKSISQFDTEVNLLEEQCYEMPKYTSVSDPVVQACQLMNSYCQAAITYNMDIPVVVDKTLISSWLTFDEEMNVHLDESAVRNWLREFGKHYDTLGTVRTFTTPAGKNAEVSGGTYGWSIDEEAEFSFLLNAINHGETITREPFYIQRGAVHGPQDWGTTYIDVDLTSQYMWYVVNGTVAMECSVVTGKPTDRTVTPTGVYSITEKLSPTVLIGEIQADGKPEYETDVDYWMRITQSGIGFHDADWQNTFGGDVYTWNGSHGCINMFKSDAQTLYSIIEVGVPVVIHY